jgi:hypothetical protein
MFTKMLDRVTYANVVATLALFVALGGSAYAAATINSADVQDKSLKGRDLKSNTVTGKQIKERSLKTVPTAQTVGGFSAAALEKSSRIQFGRATGTPASPASEGVLLEWPAMGLLITAPAQGGCSSSDEVTLHITNSGASGILILRADGPSYDVPSKSSTIACSAQSNRWEGAASTAEGLTLFFDCLRTSADVRCLGTRSTP